MTDVNYSRTSLQKPKSIIRMAANRKDPASKYYYFIDVDLHSRQIVSWDSDTQDNVDFGELNNGCYRVFLPKGQYNKLVRRLEDARA